MNNNWNNAIGIDYIFLEQSKSLVDLNAEISYQSFAERYENLI